MSASTKPTSNNRLSPSLQTALSPALRLLGRLLPTWIGFFAIITELAAENIVYPSDAAAIIDVTRPPYNCDNTGRQDCTAALNRALDDLLRPDLLGQRAIEREIAADPRDDFIHPSSVENRKVAGKWQAVFPAHLASARILYFPNGIYQVSDTVCYTFEDLHNSRGNELNRRIILQGQSEKGVVIRLRDHAAGFEAGAQKPLLSFMRKDRSNVAMMNKLANLTLSTGRGNPGAAGLRFFANNAGAVRNVTITTDDPDGLGSAGLLLDRFNYSGCYFKDITVKGFDYGIMASSNRINAVFEHLTLVDQHRAGLLVDGLVATVRDLRSINRVPAVVVTGTSAHLVLLDSRLEQTKAGPSSGPAIEFDEGVLFAREVFSTGYTAAIARFGRTVQPDGMIAEFSSHGAFSTQASSAAGHSLHLPVRETPATPWVEDPAQWISVNDYGAVGDGLHDDTAAIQLALLAGKPVVYFQPGQYLINGQIHVPAGVQRIDFMYADLAAGPALRALADRGAFVISEEAVSPLVLENLFAFEAWQGSHYLVEHAAHRALILRDLHTQTGAMYRNTVPGGTVFIENVACTDQFPPHPNPFTFRGQTVWARQLNPERGFPQVLNEGGTLWVLGFKTEGLGAGFETRDGATEILGGAANMGGDGFILNDSSDVSAICATIGWKSLDTRIVAEKSKDPDRGISSAVLPKRILFHWQAAEGYSEQVFLPLYIGRLRPIVQPSANPKS